MKILLLERSTMIRKTYFSPIFARSFSFLLMAWMILLMPKYSVQISEISCESDRNYESFQSRDMNIFPDPRLNFEECGRPRRSNICDPDGILAVEEADSLQSIIDSIHNSSCYHSEECQHEGVSVGVALVGSVELSSDILSVEIKDLSEKLRKKWRLDPNENDILILVIAKEKQLHIEAGRNAAKVIPQKTLAKISNSTFQHIKDGCFSQGLESIIQSIYDMQRDVEISQSEVQKSLVDASRFHTTGIIIGSVIGSLILILGVLYIIILFMKKKDKKWSKSHKQSKKSNKVQYQQCTREDTGINVLKQKIDDDDDDEVTFYSSKKPWNNGSKYSPLKEKDTPNISHKRSLSVVDEFPEVDGSFA